MENFSLGKILLSHRGKIVRGEFWLGYVIIFLINIMLCAVLLLHLRIDAVLVVQILLLLYLIEIYPISCLFIKRLRDRKRPLWLVPIYIISTFFALLSPDLIRLPFAIIILWIFIECAFLPSRKEDNTTSTKQDEINISKVQDSKIDIKDTFNGSNHGNTSKNENENTKINKDINDSDI